MAKLTRASDQVKIGIMKITKKTTKNRWYQSQTFFWLFYAVWLYVVVRPVYNWASNQAKAQQAEASKQVSPKPTPKKVLPKQSTKPTMPKQASEQAPKQASKQVANIKSPVISAKPAAVRQAKQGEAKATQ
jgi:hypothetical protein